MSVIAPHQCITGSMRQHLKGSIAASTDQRPIPTLWLGVPVKASALQTTGQVVASIGRH
jgi:phosphoribosylcarboxyaminoimidazole (NCAIR) mutase